jgi:hypothetical protein
MHAPGHKNMKHAAGHKTKKMAAAHHKKDECPCKCTSKGHKKPHKKRALTPYMKFAGPTIKRLRAEQPGKPFGWYGKETGRLWHAKKAEEEAKLAKKDTKMAKTETKMAKKETKMAKKQIKMAKK